MRCLFPTATGTPLLSDPQDTVVNVAQLPSETVCSTVSCINAGDQPDCPERAVIFSGCMDFELGGMQPLVKAMPEVMRVSSLLNTWPEIQPLLVAMERESLTRQAGYAGILARLADVVAALIVRGWVACGCGNATGWVQVLRDPRLAKAIYAMHQRPGVNWKVEDLAREAGLSRSLFAERFLAATGTTPARYLTELRMRLAVQYITHEGQALEKVAFSLGYQSLAAFQPGFQTHHRPAAGGPARHGTLESALYVKRYTPLPTRKRCPLKRRVGDAEHQFGQLVGSPFTEDKLLAAHVQSLLPQGLKAQQRLPAIAHRLRIDHLEHRLLKRNVAQRMRRVQPLGAQPRQPGGVVFSPLQHKGIDQPGSVAIDGEDSASG
ncbi:AraC family transcriptional regulator [Klebsiella pneumoniae]|nr:AraC family transcriptional regulator [Klebsiella pneumoniae]